MKAQERIPENDKTEEWALETEKTPYFATSRGRSLSALILSVIVAAIAVCQLNGTGGAVAYEMNERMIGVACLDYPPVFVAYDDIEELEKVTTFEMGTAIDSYDWDSGWCGTYKNETYGIYSLLAYSSPGEYIVVHHRNGVLIFNARSQSATDKAFEKLASYCGTDTP